MKIWKCSEVGPGKMGGAGCGYCVFFSSAALCEKSSAFSAVFFYRKGRGEDAKDAEGLTGEKKT